MCAVVTDDYAWQTETIPQEIFFIVFLSGITYSVVFWRNFKEFNTYQAESGHHSASY